MTVNRLLLLTGIVICVGACARSPAGDTLDQWTLFEDLRIGSIDDPETALTYLRDIAFGPDDRIYLTQDRDQQVRVFDALGTPDTVIGGPGEGPGEFRMIVDMGFFGDTLFVVDGELRRTSYFTPAGELLVTVPLAQVVPLPAVSPDGRYAFVVERTIATDARDAIFRIHRVSLDGDTTWTREHHYVPVTVPRAEYDSVNTLAVARSPALAGIIDEANPYVPFRVPVTAAIAADDGSLWLRREEQPGVPDVRWDVLNADGEAVATTTLAGSTRLLAIHNGAVYAAVTDDFGVPYLVRYRIQR